MGKKIFTITCDYFRFKGSEEKTHFSGLIIIDENGIIEGFAVFKEIGSDFLVDNGVAWQSNLCGITDVKNDCHLPADYVLLADGDGLNLPTRFSIIETSGGLKGTSEYVQRRSRVCDSDIWYFSKEGGEAEMKLEELDYTAEQEKYIHNMRIKIDDEYFPYQYRSRSNRHEALRAAHELFRSTSPYLDLKNSNAS